MPKVTIEVSDELAKLLLQAEAKLKENALAAKSDGVLDVKGTFDAIDAAGTELKLELKRRALQDLDTDRARIFVDGKEHARVGRYEAEYFTKEGPVRVTRSLYRECGKRNAKTVDTVSLRTGALDGWLPAAAKAAAFLLQQGTSREAEATARALGVLPYSRSSLERVTHDVGTTHSVVRDDVEKQLISVGVIPDEVKALSIALDRVATPFEEPRARPRGRPKKGAAKRPIKRVWHMSYTGTITLHDSKGDAVANIRYGRVPMLGCDELLARMHADVKELLSRRPDLKVAVLCDGAVELEDALDRVFTDASLGVKIHRGIDFWHVVEKLGEAARVIHGSAAKPIIERWKLLLKNSKHARGRILNELYASGKRHVATGTDGERPVHNAITYLENHGERMNFPAALAAGLPIGSGNVEATCKSLFRLRLVRPGARWKQDTAQHIVDLRAYALSDRFDAALDLALAPLIRHVRLAA